MKTTVLFVASVPMVLIGFLLLSETGTHYSHPADTPSSKLRNPEEQDGVQPDLAKQRTALPGYGDISGQILFDGEASEPKIVIRQNDLRVKDAAICAARNMLANDLLVDPKTNGVANVFVYIYHRNMKRQGIKIHPDLVELKKDEKEVVFSTKDCRFVPHVMVVRAGQHVRIKSEDRCAHNAHLSLLFNETYSSILSPTETQDFVIDHLTVAESLPMPVKCDIHPWMKAHWLIIDHPYATVTDKEGLFTIEKLPVGEIELRIWHERSGYIERKYVVTVKEGQNLLEPVRVPAEKFE